MLRRAVVAGILICSLGLARTSAATELRSIVTGLASPLYVTHAGDGSRRLFIVEQAGTIRVLQPGANSATMFLDIRGKVLSGGERGLLGLAFHPLYRTNGRFFVYYTRTPDGAIVIAEYRVSQDSNVAATTETVVLTIAHPTNANHNGGMIAFGPGGYLFIGVGDGGSGDDPPNNAQNIDALLGKLLRINVDQADSAAGTRYSSPSGNPFIGVAGRDEIYAYGLRNPWRFSFDRVTSQLWIGDVGQGAREEIDTPVTAGANFGWRVYEGFTCTNNDPSLCRPENYVRPLFDYAHSNGRCSLTGGYVYRGPSSALAAGTYVYGDYCSGEIFTWDGTAQRTLFDLATDVSSFGEDEQGELYVVSLSGTISALVTSACQPTIAPGAATVGQNGGSLEVRIVAGGGCAWTATSSAGWMAIAGASSGTGSATITLSVAPMTWKQRKRIATVSLGSDQFTLTQIR